MCNLRNRLQWYKVVFIMPFEQKDNWSIITTADEVSLPLYGSMCLYFKVNAPDNGGWSRQTLRASLHYIIRFSFPKVWYKTCPLQWKSPKVLGIVKALEESQERTWILVNKLIRSLEINFNANNRNDLIYTTGSWNWPFWLLYKYHKIKIYQLDFRR